MKHLIVIRINYSNILIFIPNKNIRNKCPDENNNNIIRHIYALCGADELCIDEKYDYHSHREKELCCDINGE